MFKRLLNLPKPAKNSFFLWGARQVGKSTLLKSTYPDAIYIDLLKADEFRRYLDHPEWLRTEILPDKKNPFVIIDEIQKVPELLDEIHWLIENKNASFALCGSSARKLKRGHYNLLGGRATRYELFGFIAKELGKEFDLERILNHGYIPNHYLSGHPKRLINSYISDYLKEEIAAEGLARNLPSFSNFLNVASFSDTEVVNFSNIARECEISSHTVKEYFQILVDTLIGRWVPAYRKKPKRRVVFAPKFYFTDVGTVNGLAKRGIIERGSELFGKVFENWICHELSAYSSYSEKFFSIAYWRLTNGSEVDFIIDDAKAAIEVKASSKINSDHLKGLRNFKIEHPGIRKRIIVCLEKKRRITSDGILILPSGNFIDDLWNGALI